MSVYLSFLKEMKSQASLYTVTKRELVFVLFLKKTKTKKNKTKKQIQVKVNQSIS